jgi:hypothetical protein
MKSPSQRRRQKHSPRLVRADAKPTAESNVASESHADRKRSPEFKSALQSKVAATSEEKSQGTPATPASGAQKGSKEISH